MDKTPFFTTNNGTLYCGDCLDIMREIPEGSVDMALCDLPYGITDCAWDVRIPLEPLWAAYKRVVKQSGAIVLTAQQPFATDLINAARPFFRYELIWEKAKALGFLNANRMPLRAHENVLVFYRRLPRYTPQFTEGKPYQRGATKNASKSVYRHHVKTGIDNAGTRHPRSVLRFSQEGRTKHPTEKPQALFEWLIRTYTAPGELVLDNCMGSGTTAAACEAASRRWIGVELNEDFCKMTVERLTGG